MKIIILGSNGMLGRYLTSYLSKNYEIIPLTRLDYDLSEINYNEFNLFINDKISKGDLIINAAGVIKQREYNSMDMIMVNSVLPHILAKIKQNYKCNVMHITTDCIYNGLDGNYNENDGPNCNDDYGMSKFLGENLTSTIIRTSIIGEELENKKSLLEWVRSNKDNTINGYENHLWNGVTCLELAKYIDEVIKNNRYWEGVRHIHSNTLNKYELVNIINDVYNLNITVIKANTKTHCFRNLSTNYKIPIIKELKKQIKELKKYKIK